MTSPTVIIVRCYNHQEEDVSQRRMLMKAKPFTLDDFMRHLDEVRKLGPMDQIMRGIPGMSVKVEVTKIIGADLDSALVHMQAIYNSMTNEERRNTNMLDDHRRRRIARGAGVELSDFTEFMKRFEMASEAMRWFDQQWGNI